MNSETSSDCAGGSLPPPEPPPEHGPGLPPLGALPFCLFPRKVEFINNVISEEAPPICLKNIVGHSRGSTVAEKGSFVAEQDGLEGKFCWTLVGLQCVH